MVTTHYARMSHVPPQPAYGYAITIQNNLMTGQSLQNAVALLLAPQMSTTFRVIFTVIIIVPQQ